MEVIIDTWFCYVAQMVEQRLPLIIRHLRKDLIDLLALLGCKIHLVINPLFLFLSCLFHVFTLVNGCDAMGNRQGASQRPPGRIADGHIGAVDGIVLYYFAFVNSFIWLYLKSF